MLNNTLKSLKSKNSSKKGFTLMEMLIVVAIIAILVAIAIPTFNSSLNKARLAADKANLRAAYAEASADYMSQDTTPTNYEKEITYGSFKATATADANGKITVKATAGLQCTSSGAVNTYSDGSFSET